MNFQDDVVSLMDLLDLDEEIIDNRLKSIIEKEKLSNKHLLNVIQLLQYKQLVNVQDGIDCENDEELEFAAKLIRDINEENVGNVCKIVAIVLGLNGSTLVTKAEHLLQQILVEIDLPAYTRDPDTPEQNPALWNFKIADSILDTVIKASEKLALPFLELPVKTILHSSDETLKVYFLTNTVPKLFEGISGYSILDKIWEHVKELQGDNREVCLNVLSSLSEYYLPVPDSKGNILFESVIVYQYEFWDNVLYGLLSTDPSLRKISIYVAKRALDCVVVLNKHVSVKSNNNTIFTWNHCNKKNLRLLWDNFFILLDSLEEKQSNIVLPSLQLFGSLKSLGNWLNCAFNIGLKHDNTQVRSKCIQHRLEFEINSKEEATVFLEALNDIYIYDDPLECKDLKKKFCKFLSDTKVFIHVFTAIPTIKWLPVPFYHLTAVLSEIKFKESLSETNIQISQTIIDMLKVPCNNVIIRKALFVNISDFVVNCCGDLHWKEILGIYSILQAEMYPDHLHNSINSLMCKTSMNDDEKTELVKAILESNHHINFGILYLQEDPLCLSIFTELLLRKCKHISEIVSRQYSNKSEHLQDIIYLTQMFIKTKNAINSSQRAINEIILREYKTIVYYILSLLSNDSLLTIDQMSIISSGVSYMSVSIKEPEHKEIMLQLYKTAVLLMKDKDTVLETKVLSMFLLNSLKSNTILLTNYKHEMLSLKDILTLTVNFENKESIGRLRNVFYEKTCEMVDALIKDQEAIGARYIKDIAEFVENVIECGGYGCLRHCLNIINAILPFLLEDGNLKYDIIQLINRMWKEIEELKSNNQYNPCTEEFVHLITQDVFLKIPMYNNVVILYCNKIIEQGSVKNAPLFCLVTNIMNKEITPDYGQLMYVLCEILLYVPVPRKDQRIIENLQVEILQDPKIRNKQQFEIRFHFQIQYLSILTLTKIMNKDVLSYIEQCIKSRINEVFKNKQRYHGHSQAHRLLLMALQHLLLLAALKPNENEGTVNWCIDLLARLPHQPSVRICLEWYIAFHFYIQEKIIDQEVLKIIKKIPLTSQFTILFWTIKHKIQKNGCSVEEYEFVMDFLLSHTMGQMFNIRLNSQYLATKLYEIHKKPKYSYTISLIENTFSESTKDKNFIKLKQDYFVNYFDVVKDFTPGFIYYFLPKYCEINNNESVDMMFVKDIIKKINSNIKNHDFFNKEGLNQMSDEEIFSMKTWKDGKSKVVDDIEDLGPIQKKYIPWKNMCDVNVYEAGKKKKSSSELIVVASLIDKLPNLGGMARTSEVFGVKSYVVDSLRHLQDKQFQGLSVSAERWIDVEEVRPGQPLKQYLLQKKAEGYSVVAAEQTSTSVKLQSFKFPKKTLLLLGHEKEGIPCDLLPMMDSCVEIPQQGFVRSLNVHVTAAIFVWEYARQNIL